MLDELKKDVLRYAQLSYREKLFAGTSGNLSIYDPASRMIVITPSGLPYESMTLDDIVVIALDGTVVDGHRKPSSEWRLHKAVYVNKPGACAVVHTHSPYATSFAITKEPIPLVLVEMMLFLGGDIPVAAFAPAGTDELAAVTVAALKDRAACLMANHGVLAVASDIEKAHLAAVYTEDVAKIYAIALSHGKVLPLNIL